MQKILEKIAQFVIYATFFIPLVVGRDSFIFPFIVPKVLLFRGAMLVVLGIFTLLLISNWKMYRPRLTPLNVTVGIFLLGFTLSTFFGTDAYHSFWDNHERMLGLFTILHYGILFYVSSVLFRSWEQWQTALKVFLIAGSLVMIVGVIQVFKPDFMLNNGAERVIATLGNAVYVGNYGLFLFFNALLLFVREKNLYWRVAIAIMGILGICGILFSGTRGAVAGLFVGLGLVLMLYTLFLGKENRRLRLTFASIIGVFVVALGLIVIFRSSAFVAKIPAVGRLVNTSIADFTNSSRFFAWEIALKSWKDHPLLGWGPNNFFYAFNQHYNPRSLEFGYGETWFDNAHNILLNTLATQGLFGLLAYFAVLGASVFAVWYSYKRGGSLHIAVITTAFLVGNMVQNLTVFENPTSYLYSFFWLAMINSMSSVIPTLSNQETGATRRLGVGSVTVVGFVIAVLIFIFNIQPARANHQTLLVMQEMLQTRHIDIPTIEKLFSFSSPHIDDIRSDITRTVSELLFGLYQKASPKDVTQVAELSKQTLNQNVDLHPLDIRNFLAIAQLNQLEALINNDPQYLVQAESALTRATMLSPQRQQVLFGLANTQFQLGKTQDAVDMLKEVIASDPLIGEGYWRLAFIYKTAGQPDAAKKIIADAVDRGARFTQQDQQNIAGILASSPTSQTTSTDKNKKK